MEDTKVFQGRQDFREWLENNCMSHEGIWILFSKTKDMKMMKPQDALEEALCFGWIDGLMKSIDDKKYMKYFSIRRENSQWSLKNKNLAESLESQGLMTEFGRMKIEDAKRNGKWESANKPSDITMEQIENIIKLLKDNQLAQENFQAMSLSVKKTYTRAYLDAKTDGGRLKRLMWMKERLEKNLKPM